MTESERERIRRERRQIVAEYGDLFHKVAEILFRHDPVGINFDTNTDEYEPEAGTILPRLRECSSAIDARRVIHEEFVRWFDGPRSTVAGEQSRYDDAAREIWDAWKRSTLS